MANQTFTIAYLPHPDLALSHNWLTDRPKERDHHGANKRYGVCDDYFDQIVSDAAQALGRKNGKKAERIIYVFTQEQVDGVIALATFSIHVQKYNFYFILTKGE